MDNAALIDRIKALAKEKGIKLKFICANLGVAESYLGNVRSGRDRMTPERLKIIADILSTTPEHLSGEPETSHSSEVPDIRLEKITSIFQNLPDDESKDRLLRVVEAFALSNRYETESRYTGGIAAKGGNAPIIRKGQKKED